MLQKRKLRLQEENGKSVSANVCLQASLLAVLSMCAGRVLFLSENHRKVDSPPRIPVWDPASSGVDFFLHLEMHFWNKKVIENRRNFQYPGRMKPILQVLRLLVWVWEGLHVYLGLPLSCEER